MTSVPLHPALVHLPLGLAFIIPLLAAGFAWALWTGRIRTRGWAVIVALQALLLAAGFMAMNTGEREEDRVERVVPASAIKQHEAYAEGFVLATGVTLGLSALVLVFRRPTAVRALTAATVIGTVAVAGSAVLVGKAGGQLVYAHDAAAAYAGSAPERAQVAHEDHDERER